MNVMTEVILGKVVRWDIYDTNDMSDSKDISYIGDCMDSSNKSKSTLLHQKYWTILENGTDWHYRLSWPKIKQSSKSIVTKEVLSLSKVYSMYVFSWYMYVWISVYPANNMKGTDLGFSMLMYRIFSFAFSLL